MQKLPGLYWLVPPLLTVIFNVCVAVVYTPPLAGPPLSISLAETTAEPVAFTAGVKVNVPVGLIAGCDAKSALLLFVTMNASVWPASLAGPTEMFVAQLLTVCAPAFCITVWS